MKRSSKSIVCNTECFCELCNTSHLDDECVKLPKNCLSLLQKGPGHNENACFSALLALSVLW